MAGGKTRRSQRSSGHYPELYKPGNRRDLSDREYPERGSEPDRGSTGIQETSGGVSSETGRSGRAGFQEQDSSDEQYAFIEAL